MVLHVDRDPATGMERPHWEEEDTTGDWADCVDHVDYGTLRYIGAAYGADDTGLGQARLIQRGVAAWNLVGDEGKPLFVNIPSIDKLRLAQSTILVAWFDQPQYRRGLTAGAETQASDPNGSGGSSVTGPREPRRSKRSTQRTRS